MSATVSVIESADHAAVLLKPEHQRLLALLSTPNSAAGLARTLSWSRQIANYHLKELENAGLITLHEERKRGNCLERVMRRAAASYLISPQTLGDLAADPARVPDKLSISYLLSVAARIIREVSRLARAAADAGKVLPTLTLDTQVRFRNARDRAAFTAELTNAVAALISRYHDAEAPGGRSFRLIAAAYPLVSPTEERNKPHATDTAT